jgi:hypothetical protein
MSLLGARHPSFMLLSPLGERAGEGAKQETLVGLTHSPNLFPKGGEEHEGLNHAP